MPVKMSMTDKAKDEKEIFDEIYTLVNNTNNKYNQDAMATYNKTIDDWANNCSDDAKNLIKELKREGYTNVVRGAIQKNMNMVHPRHKNVDSNLKYILEGTFSEIKKQEYESLTELRERFKKRILEVAVSYNI